MKRIKWQGLALALTGALLVATVGNAAKYDSVLDKVKAEGVLKVGMAQTTPGCYIDVETGKWTGITVDLFKDLAEEMGVRLEITETSWDLFMVALNNREFDVYGSTTFYLPSRALRVAYTVPLFYKGVGLIVAGEDKRFQNLSDVERHKGVRIGVRVGAVEETVIPEFFPDAEIISYKTDTAPEIAQGIPAGLIDIWAADEVMQSLFLKKNPWARLIGVVGSHPIGLAVRPGDPAWLNFLDSYIEYIRASGMLAKYFKTYGQPLRTLYPPKF